MTDQTYNSVCIATYNGEKHIKEQLQSILAQIQPNDEVIVSDDGSTDGTLDLIESFQDPRIRIYKHLSSGRPTENFENALMKSTGRIIFLSDQDDVWLPNKYAEIVKHLAVYDLVLSNSMLVDQELRTVAASFFKYHGSGRGVIRNAIKNSYFGSCMAFRRELLTHALPFPPTREIGHDTWLGLVGEMVGKVYHIDEPLILYRRHSDAVTSHGMSKSKRSLAVKLWSRVIVLQYVLMFYIKYKLNWKKD